MANRRMLHKNISYSEQVNSLTDFEKILFTWAIPHLDDFGRIEGDAPVLKAKVMPMDKRTVKEFKAAIERLEKTGLIITYKVGTKTVIVYPKFDSYQTGLNKRTKSRFPDPPDKFFKEFPEIPRYSNPTQPNLTEPNLTKPNLTEENGREPNLTKETEIQEGFSLKKKQGRHSSTKEEFHPETYEEEQALAIAAYVREKDWKKFILLVREGKFWLLEKAFGEYREAENTQVIEAPAAYFAGIVTRIERGDVLY
jgi:hypothetical protein